jgi:hypothetical protein
MFENELYNERKANFWLKNAVESLFSLYDDNLKGFHRNTIDLAKDKAIYSTASFHAYSALLTCGYLLDGEVVPFFIDNNDDKLKKLLITEQIDIITNLFGTVWIKKCLENSSNSGKRKDDDRLGIRALIVLERILVTLSLLKEKYNDETFDVFCIEGAIQSCELLNNDSNWDDKFFPDVGASPFPILNLTICLKTIQRIDPTLFQKFNKLKSYLEQAIDEIDRHINYHMSRNKVDFDFAFDPVSLTTAIYCKSILDDNFKRTGFFQACLTVIMESQYPNGTWPTGVSLSHNSSGDVVQQPSVEISAFLAEAAIDNSFLTDINEDIEKTLSIVLPGFRKILKFIELTYEEVETESNKYNGWSSDRIGTKGYIETWITSLICRFTYKLWLAEKAYLRIQSLKKLGISSFQSRSLSSIQSKDIWSEKIINPDSITGPKTAVYEMVVNSILVQKNKNKDIIIPDPNQVSFIIFGPPGSGKTFFIETLAKVLDWPLVELSPGHFIKNGLELIETTTKEIFDLIENLNHAIVFFDECDELLRERTNTNENITRTILSFATASMLPKLQKLHDRRNVVFVLGTNYLANIDIAIKRPGRFDDIILFDRPDFDGRIEHIKKHLKGKPSPAELNNLAEETEFYTIPEIKKSCELRRPLPENTVAEYKDWCKKFGSKELKNSRYSQSVQKKVKERWGIIKLKIWKTK